MSPSPPFELCFTVTPGDDAWTVVGPTPEAAAHVVPNPLRDPAFLNDIERLRRYSCLKFSPTDTFAIRQYEAIASDVSARITPLLLSDAAREQLTQRMQQVQRGRTRLTLRVADPGPLGDRILALPWEVVSPDRSEFPVRQSLLEVVREVLLPHADELPEVPPPLSVAVAVAAPEDQAGFSYERQEVRLVHALAPLGRPHGASDASTHFSNLGTLDDLVELVATHQASAILFNGHGRPGHLVFEDPSGAADPVAADELVRRLRTHLLDPRRGGAFPSVFFLACCDGAASDWGPSLAATLHRSGFAQVIGFVSGVRDSAASRAAHVFFRALSEGDHALQAAHRARAALVDAFEYDGEHWVFPLAWTQFAVYFRGTDRPVAAGRRPVARRWPARIRRHTDSDRGQPVLKRGFIGRRAVQHEIFRKIVRGERLIVLHGLGGGGKTELISHLLSRGLPLEPGRSATLWLQVVDRQTPEEAIGGWCRQIEASAREHAATTGRETSRSTPDPSSTPARRFGDAVRALHADCPQLVLAIDRLDALQNGPSDQGALGSWKVGGAEVSQELERLAAQGVLILVSTRLAHPDMPPRSFLAVPPMSSQDAFRMTSFANELAMLTLAERRRVVAWSDGSPRAIQALDAAVEQHRREQGLGYVPLDTWRDLVLPAMRDVDDRLRQELGLSDLWNGLTAAARAHVRELAAEASSLSLADVDRLGPARDDLVRRGLLVRHLDEAGLGRTPRWIERWTLPTRLVDLIGTPT